MYTDWNPTWLRSTPGCPMAYTSTASSTTDAVSSMIADSRSATSVIPIGAGHPPACTVATPSSSTRPRMTAEIGTRTMSVLSPITRCAWRERPVRMHKAAARSGSRIGSGSRTLMQGSVRRGRLVHAVAVGVPGVGDLGVRCLVATDAAVLDVVGNLVVGGQQPAAVGEREQQGRDAEADDDRGQHQ